MRFFLILWLVLVGCGSAAEKVDPFAAQVTEGKKRQRTVKECPANYDPMQFRTSPGRRLAGGLAEMPVGYDRSISEEIFVSIVERTRTAYFHYENDKFPCTNLGANDRWGMELSAPFIWKKEAAERESAVVRSLLFTFDGFSPQLKKTDDLPHEGHSLQAVLSYYDEVSIYEVEVGAEWEMRVVKNFDLGPRRISVQGKFSIRH